MRERRLIQVLRTGATIDGNLKFNSGAIYQVRVDGVRRVNPKLNKHQRRALAAQNRGR